MEEETNLQVSRFKAITRNPIFLGCLIGFLAALGQALLINAGGPPAYGFCVACHTRDLINKLINTIFATNLGLAPVSKNSILPSLSIVGVIIGGYFAAKINKEFKVKTGNWHDYLLYFLGGFLVLISALLVGGCPYRNALRFGYGDLIAMISIIFMIIGIFVGGKIILYRMNKQMELNE